MPFQEHKNYSFYFDPAFPDRAFATSSDGLYLITLRGWQLQSRSAYAPISIPGQPEELLTITGAYYNHNLTILRSNECYKQGVPVVTLLSDYFGSTRLGSCDAKARTFL